MKYALTVAKFAATLLIGWLMLLNAQPWLTFADTLAPMIKSIPFLDALISIPFFGGWIEFLFANLAAAIGISTWALIQFCEILPMAINKEQIIGNLIRHWQGIEFDSKKEKNEALKKLKEMFNKLPIQDLEALETYRKWAYVVEFIGCSILYLPYTGGFQALIDDAPAWDFDSILWGNVLMIPVSMFGFEWLLKVVIRMWRLGRVAREVQV